VISLRQSPRDLATSVLAIVTLLALRARLGPVIGLVWLTNIVGTANLANALVGGGRYDIARLGMGRSGTS
jgi:hypothetical protein